MLKNPSTTNKVGDISLSKGAYMALMKRQNCLNMLSQSCQNTPMQDRVLSSKNKFSSCSKAQIDQQQQSTQQPSISKSQYNNPNMPPNYTQQGVTKRIKKPTPKSPSYSAIKHKNDKENQVPEGFNQGNNPSISSKFNNNNNNKNQKQQSAIIKKQSQSQKDQQLNNTTNNNNSQKQQNSNQQWHKIAKNADTVHKIFIGSKFYNQKQKKTQKKILQGYQVKFYTQKKDIWAFNCYKEKDMDIKSEFSQIINLNLDNDCPSDDEQVAVAVKNMFYTLCLSIHEEKLLSQSVSNQNTQKNYITRSISKKFSRKNDSTNNSLNYSLQQQQ